ncbi:MAG: DUF6893 family small protein [Pyrinomonadaceae bacterium]
MKRNQSLVRRESKSSGMGVWSIVGGLALMAVAAVVITSLPDLQRYIKISRM